MHPIVRRDGKRLFGETRTMQECSEWTPDMAENCHESVEFTWREESSSDRSSSSSMRAIETSLFESTLRPYNLGSPTWCDLSRIPRDLDTPDTT